MMAVLYLMDKFKFGSHYCPCHGLISVRRGLLDQNDNIYYLKTCAQNILKYQIKFVKGKDEQIKLRKLY